MPNGLPIASTSSPTCNLDESPRVATVRPLDGGVIFTTARSSAESVPTSCAGKLVPSNSVTFILCAPLTTWLLVTIYPRPSIMTPEPMAPPCWVVTFTSTTAGRTFAITASRTACSLLPVSGGTVDCGPVPGCNVATFELAPPVDPLVLPNCQPANKPTPRTTRSTNDRAIIAPVRTPVEGLGFTGGVCICPGRAWCGAVIGVAG